MKKLIVCLVALSLPNLLYAALGVFRSLDSVQAYTDPPSSAVVRWSFSVVYEGNDVPGGTQNASLSVQVSSSTGIATVAANIVTTIKNEATNRGFTAATVYMPSYIAQ